MTLFETINELKYLGFSYNEIGIRLGLSRQRIHKIHHTFKDLIKSKHVTEIEKRCRRKLKTKKAFCKKNNIEFDLTFENVKWEEYCPIFGIKLDYFSSETKDTCASFDRIDPKKGYLASNVRIISYKANTIKNVGTIEEHEQIVNYMKKLLTTS